MDGPKSSSSPEIKVIVKVGVLWGSDLQQKLTHVVDEAALKLIDRHGNSRVPAQHRDYALLATTLLQTLVQF